MSKKALEFATKAHAGQVRKYSGEPYITHPVRVAERVSVRVFDVICPVAPTNQLLGNAIIEAAILHDTVEDCDVTLEDLKDNFDEYVADLVEEVTNVYESDAFPHLNRAQRNKLEVERLAEVSSAARIIKLADRVDNLLDMPAPTSNRLSGFLKVYTKESAWLLDALKGTDEPLESQLRWILKNLQNGIKAKDDLGLVPNR